MLAHTTVDAGPNMASDEQKNQQQQQQNCLWRIENHLFIRNYHCMVNLGM